MWLHRSTGVSKWWHIHTENTQSCLSLLEFAVQCSASSILLSSFLILPSLVPPSFSSLISSSPTILTSPPLPHPPVIPSFTLSLSPSCCPRTPLPSLDHSPALAALFSMCRSSLSFSSHYAAFCLFSPSFSLSCWEPSPGILHRSPWPQLSQQRAVLYVKWGEGAAQWIEAPS